MTIMAKLIGLPVKILQRLYANSWVNTMKWCWYQFSWRYLEWRLGINTGEFSQKIVLGDDGECNGYEPIDFKCFDNAMDYLKVRPGKDVFLDYGCGKGRAVVLAATYPFQRVIGIERSPQLCTIAKEQVRKAKRKLKSQRVEIVNGDATTYEVPQDVTKVFLFNSFTGNVLSDTLNRIRDSLVKFPRNFKIVYIFPKNDRNMLAECKWLREECILPTGFWTHVKSIVYDSRIEYVTIKAGKSAEVLIEH